MTKPGRTIFLIVEFLVAVFAFVYFVGRVSSNAAVAYSDPLEHFKYGSTGGEILAGIPYSIWMTLPRIFNLPGGRYESFGFLHESGKDLRIGVSKRRYRGIERVSFTCAICDHGSVRDTPDSKPLLVAGMLSNTVDLRAFYKFLFGRGKTVCDQLCDRCNGPDGVNFAPNYKDLSKVTPIADIGTDRQRTNQHLSNT